MLCLTLIPISFLHISLKQNYINNYYKNRFFRLTTSPQKLIHQKHAYTFDLNKSHLRELNPQFCNTVRLASNMTKMYGVAPVKHSIFYKQRYCFLFQFLYCKVMNRFLMTHSLDSISYCAWRALVHFHLRQTEKGGYGIRRLVYQSFCCGCSIFLGLQWWKLMKALSVEGDTLK